MFGSSALVELPDGHSPVDWTKWSPPGEGDVRSPCPAINALANHGILPRNGKGISKAMAVEALKEAYHLDSLIANVFSMGGVASNPDHSAHSFDLNHVSKHGFIEHDGSLSREDAAFGDQAKFDKQKFDQVLEIYRQNAITAKDVKGNDVAMTNWRAASKARYARITSSKTKHESNNKQFNYGLKEAIASYGESSLMLNVLGKDGQAPIEWLRIFFEEERLPFAEGWRPPTHMDQGMLNHGYAEMVKAHDHKAEEAQLIGVGTVEALTMSILSIGASLMKTPHLGASDVKVEDHTTQQPTQIGVQKPVQRPGEEKKKSRCIVQ